MNLPFPDLLDSSMLATFKSCPAKFYHEYVENWKAKGKSVHLHAGGAFAHGMEKTRRSFYELGNDKETAIAEGLGALLAYYGDFQTPPESAKSAHRMAGAFESYWDNYSLDQSDFVPISYAGGKRGIEFSFAHPLPILRPDRSEPIIYCGRMDAIVGYAGGTFICDEKTTTQLGDSWAKQWTLRSQFTGYAWGCRESGLKVDGVVVRGVAILKTMYKHAQDISYRSQWMIDKWYEELLSWVEDIKHCYTTGVWKHNFDHACSEYGGCGFMNVCQSEEPDKWLETAFERKIWNPLLRTEKLLNADPPTTGK